MVSSVATPIMVHGNIQPPLHRPILLPTFEEDSHFRGIAHGAVVQSREAIVSAISGFPTSNLQSLSVDLDCDEMPWVYFKDSFFSFALRCGQSLTKFAAPVSLSVAAMTHLSHLPHLRAWGIQGPPPSDFASSFPLIFPPLTSFTLGESAASGWLPLFEMLERGASTAQRTTPLSKMKESLRSLVVEDLPGTSINVSSTSPIQIFRNLVDLAVKTLCHYEPGGVRCVFKLNDNNIAGLATALPY